MPFVAFDVLAATAPHATRKPAAHADREGSTQFSDMLDKPDSTAQGMPPTQASDQPKDQDSPVQASSKQGTDEALVADAKAAVSLEAGTAEAQPAQPSAAADKPATQQEIADFLAAVAAATGMKITPVVQPKSNEKADDKPAENEPDDRTDDATAATDAAAPAGTKSADAAAVAIAVPSDNAASAPETSPGIAPVTTGQAAARPVGSDEAATPDDVKDAKPQAAVKVDAAPATPALTPETSGSETKPLESNLAPAQPVAAQPHGQKQTTEAPAQAAKPVPVQHEIRALDAASTKPADNVQPVMPVQNHTAAPAADQAAVAAAPAATPQAVALPVAGIAIEIAGKAMAGKNRFEIRLDPPELGKIHVRLDVDHKGEVTSIITADRSDTFDLLRRDAQVLERALQDAGVKTSNNGLQFSLRDQSTGRHDQPALADSARVILRDDNLDTDTIAPVYRSFSGNRAGVDIRV